MNLTVISNNSLVVSGVLQFYPISSNTSYGISNVMDPPT